MTTSSAANGVIRLFTRAHVTLNRLSGGRLFNRMGGDVCFVTMKGAKSGRMSTRPLMYVPYNQGILLVSSLGGSDRNPAWYYNIKANPDIEVRYRTNPVMVLRARLATAEEKPALWPLCDAVHADFATYRLKTDRDIPIFVCEPPSDP